ncbi:MAG TPA: hypothetical protein VF636_10120 [Sphingomonas sp.]|jgi:hypothetical protein
MSHIPSSAMPHAQAHDDAADGAAGATAEKPRPDPTTATPDQKTLGDGAATGPAPYATSATQRAAGEAPLSSAGPGTATGNRQGGDADRALDAISASGVKSGGQSAVDGTVTAQDDGAPSSPEPAPRSGRSRLGIAALALGGLALVGGVAAALFPRGGEEVPKPKKGKRRKKG